jgi:hypothetical protein
MRILAGIESIAVVAACSPNPPPPAIRENLLVTSNSVGTTMRMLSQLVLLVDRQGRAANSLPDSLPQVRAQLASAPLNDAWGQAFRYETEGLRFAIRSRGGDGLPGNADDVVATGHLGRSVPCEVRSDRGSHRDEPPCDAAGDIVVLPFCPALRWIAIQEAGAKLPRSDRTGITGARLVALARKIDGYAREVGQLPSGLRAVTREDQLVDAWGRPMTYARRGHDFEVRSAGADGATGTTDDVTVSGRMGTPARCEFRTESGLRRCEDPVPPCTG